MKVDEAQWAMAAEHDALARRRAPTRRRTCGGGPGAGRFARASLVIVGLIATGKTRVDIMAAYRTTKSSTGWRVFSRPGDKSASAGPGLGHYSEAHRTSDAVPSEPDVLGAHSGEVHRVRLGP